MVPRGMWQPGADPAAMCRMWQSRVRTVSLLQYCMIIGLCVYTVVASCTQHRVLTSIEDSRAPLLFRPLCAKGI